MVALLLQERNKSRKMLRFSNRDLLVTACRHHSYNSRIKALRSKPKNKAKDKNGRYINTVIPATAGIQRLLRNQQ